MKEKPKKVGWIQTLFPWYDPRTAVEIARAEIEEKRDGGLGNHEIAANGFEKRMNDVLETLKPEPVVWSLCKHFPWTEFYKGSQGQQVGELSREEQQDFVYNIQVKHEEVRLNYLDWFLNGVQGVENQLTIKFSIFLSCLNYLSIWTQLIN